MHPTVFYKDVMGILDSSNRPVITGFDSFEGPFQGRLFGYPVYVSAEFPINQAVGSGTNQRYIVFTNHQYLHIGDEGGLELQVSFERYFDSNATAIRGVRRVDYGYAPAAAIVIMAGVNV
jgi:HK97 family phage major capsid protein